jgi:hypothetical protein
MVLGMKLLDQGDWFVRQSSTGTIFVGHTRPSGGFISTDRALLPLNWELVTPQTPTLQAAGEAR